MVKLENSIVYPQQRFAYELQIFESFSIAKFDLGLSHLAIATQPVNHMLNQGLTSSQA